MGVTIHFEGRLIDENAFDSLIHDVRTRADARQWLTEPIENAEVTLCRVDAEEKSWDYIGPSKGIVVYVAKDCDPLRFEFDTNLYVQEYVKTQFAGAETHIDVIELLRALERYFEKLLVTDQAEFWDTNQRQVLEDHIETCNRTIQELASAKPGAQIKVRTPSGRIIDLIT